MATEWFFRKDDQQFGPFAAEQLRQMARGGMLQPTDLVWKEGMANPQQASKVKGLFDVAPTASPPQAVVTPPLPQSSPVETVAQTKQAGLVENLKTAGTLATKQAELARIKKGLFQPPANPPVASEPSRASSPKASEPAPTDLKKIAAIYNEGLRKLVLTVAATPGLQSDSLGQFRQKTALLDNQVEEVRSRSTAIQRAKEELDRLQQESKKRQTESKEANTDLEALSQAVGEAAYREVVAGRMADLPAVQSRREIEEEIKALTKEQEQAAKAAPTGLADKAKGAANSIKLSGKLLLLKQKLAAADKEIGIAVLEARQEEQVLATNATDLLTRTTEARKAIAACEVNLTAANQGLADWQSRAVAQFNIDIADPPHLEDEQKKCAARLLELECEKLSARWQCGQALLSSPQTLPKEVRQLAAELSQLASDHPEACRQPSTDKQTVLADLKEKMSLLHETLGQVVFENVLWKDTLTAEFNKVSTAKDQKRVTALRDLGLAAYKKHGDMMAQDESTKAIVSDVQAIERTIKELGGEELTAGQAGCLAVGCLAVLLLICAGVVGSMGKLPNTGEEAEEGRQAATDKYATNKPPDLVNIAVAGAEPDKNRFEQATSWGESLRVGVLKKIIKKLNSIPGEYASNAENSKFRTELGDLIDEFKAIPFNGSYQENSAKEMLTLYEKKIKGRYSGYYKNILEEEMSYIAEQYRERDTPGKYSRKKK